VGLEKFLCCLSYRIVHNLNFLCLARFWYRFLRICTKAPHLRCQIKLILFSNVADILNQSIVVVTKAPHMLVPKQKTPYKIVRVWTAMNDSPETVRVKSFSKLKLCDPTCIPFCDANILNISVKVVVVLIIVANRNMLWRVDRDWK
jgi:hypothetical protein